MTRLKLGSTWELGAELGSGGFGHVVRARAGDIKSAIKFVPKAPGAERELLFAELTGVRNVVPVIDSGETSDSWVLVMPLASCSLRDQLANGPLTVEDATKSLVDICTALADLDGRVVHRDLKPENVLLLDGRGASPTSASPDTPKRRPLQTPRSSP